LQIQPGPNNPLSSNPSITYVTDSDSLIIVPMFDAATPITSGQTQMMIVGFMQVFIQYVGNPQNTVYTTIINVTRCSGGGGAGSPPPRAERLPVRLAVHCHYVWSGTTERSALTQLPHEVCGFDLW
jgi:hypothetical protein